MEDIVVRLKHKNGYVEQIEVEPNTVEGAKNWVKHAKKHSKYYDSIDMWIYQRIG